MTTTENLKDLLAQQDALAKRIADLRTAEKAKAIETVRGMIADYGLTPGDCGFRGQTIGASPRRGDVAPKFQGPNGERWSGRGPAPNWLTALEAQGQGREKFKV